MKLRQKLTATILTIMMLMGYITTLGNVVIATGINLTGQNSKTNNANVEMNSYFTGENHSQTFEIGKEAKVFFRVKVKNTGYLKNTTIKLMNSNYEFVVKDFKNAQVQNITSDEIKLKQINVSDEEIILEVPIQIVKAEKVATDLLDSISEVKITGTYIDANGKEKQIEKEIKQQVKWKTETEIELVGEISKYIPYHEKEEYGVIMQAKITSNVKDNSLPVKNTKLEVTLPEIALSENTVKPTRISVIANSTIATNGINNGEAFNTENYHYDEERNVIIIETKNEADNEGKITWKQGKDEYLVTYTFVGKEIYDMVNNQLVEASKTKLTEEEKQAGKKNENAITGDINVKSTIQTYQEDEKPLEKEGKISYSIEEKLGNIVDFSMSSTNTLSKGYIYANYAKQEAKKDNKKQATYEQTYYAQIYDANLNSGIEFQTSTEKLAKDEKEVGKNIITKKIVITENNFKKILGEEGKIEVTDTKGNALGTIDSKKESKDGNYVLDISQKNINEVIIKTSKAIVEGKLEIKLEKAFSTAQTYTKAEIKEFSKMTVGVIAKANNYTVKLQKEITLTEPVSKAELSIGEGKQNLSAVVQNKDVSIRVVLDTSSVENALYKNPAIEIQMPKQVKKVDIKSSNILLDDELKIKETKVVNQNGRQIIKIKLEGTQTDYYGTNNNQKQNNVIAKGANIILNTDITLNPLSASKTEQVVMYYTNQNTDLYEETYTPKTPTRTANTQAIGMTKTGITIVGQNEVVTASGISNYAEGKEDILSATEGTTMATLKPYADKKVATISGKIVNNYPNTVKDVVILGRFPAKDNKKIDTTQSLGSTFNASLDGEITLTGIYENKYKIYYSNNVEASKDLSDTNNGWTTTALADAKSYMIVLEQNYELPSETQIDFSYNVQIPKNLSYNQSSYTMYKIYYTNVSEEGQKSESKISHIIGITTGIGPDININLKAATSTVREGQIVKMIATIKNTGTIKAEDAKLLITAPEGTVHTEIIYARKYYSDSKEEEKIFELGTINPGETITKEYQLRIKKSSEYEKDESEENPNTTIENVVRLSASNIEDQIRSESYNLTINKGDLSIVNIPSKHETDILKKDDKVQYRVNLENISEDTHLENVTLHATLPTGIKIEDVYYIRKGPNSEEKLKDGVNINGNAISVNVGKLESVSAYVNEAINANPDIDEEALNEIVNSKLNGICTEVDVYIDFSVENFQGKYDCIMNATADNMEEHYSNVQQIAVEKVELQFNQQELDQKYVKEGSQYSYNFTLKNNGKVTANSTKMEMTLPEGVSFVKAKYLRNGETKELTSSNKQSFTIDFYKVEPNETINIIVIVEANILPDEKDKEVTTVASILADGINKIESNKVKAIIEYDENAHIDTDEPNDNPDITENHRKITGTAWLDENKDGKRDENEELLPEIQVLLIYKNDSKLVASTTTDRNGKYEFNQINSGEYLVVFLYDASKYNITHYQKSGVVESNNSDATSMKIVLDGEQRYAGVSNTIKVSNSNVRDIDIGLYVSEKFDLRLDKYISKVTVTTPTDGTKIYNYNNSKLTKREIYGKDVGKSSVIVEYKIVVTNEGQVEGYAKKLIDYLPQEAKFSTELNKDWYLASSGTGAVLNSSLANEKIAPGQSKEVKLVLSYSVTEKIIGALINNNAEIYESYNEQGLNDMDSIIANRLESEDDMSNADIIISLATGKIILYVSLTIAVIVILGFGVFEIKKRVLTKNKD